MHFSSPMATFATMFAIVAAQLCVAVTPPFGQLSVSGKFLVGSNGQPVQLRGMSLIYDKWESVPGGFWNPTTVQKLKCSWHCTIIRAAMDVENSGGYLHDPVGEQNKVIAVVDAAIANGIYVLISFQYSSGNMYPQQAGAFFDAMSSRYANKPNVLYELWNEPVGVDWNSQMVPYYMNLIKIIRSHDANAVIICGTPNWDMWPAPAADRPIAGQRNIMYTMHFYSQDLADSGNTDTWIRTAQDAVNKNLPIFITEWGTGSGSTNKTANIQISQKVLSFLDANKISHINWCIWTLNAMSHPIKPGTTADKLDRPDVLTPDGVYIKNMLVSSNPAPVGC